MNQVSDSLISPASGAPPRRQSWRVGTGERVGAGILSGACLAVLVLAACLTPSASGHGTHQQLGLQPCGFAVYFGKPCFTCGMTTAFARAAHRDYVGSFLAQPAGSLLAVGAAAGVWIAGYVAATGSAVGRVCGRLLAPRLLFCYALIGLAAWAYKAVTWPG